MDLSYDVGFVDFDKFAVVNPSRCGFGDWAECLLMGWFNYVYCAVSVCPESEYATIVFSAGIPHLHAWIPTPLFPDLSGTYIFCGCRSILQISVPRLFFFNGVVVLKQIAIKI